MSGHLLGRQAATTELGVGLVGRIDFVARREQANECGGSAGSGGLIGPGSPEGLIREIGDVLDGPGVTIVGER
jgi:hypothetical protein